MLTALRKYRLLLEPPFFNNNDNGIALFDLTLTFFIAYIIEPYILPHIKISKHAYYLSLIPLGIIIHLFTKQNTFLNSKLFNDTSLNIYKIIVIFIVYNLIKELIKLPK